MNRDRILNQIREQAPRRPSILGNYPVPTFSRILKLAPFEAITDDTMGEWDVVILDNSLCFEPEPVTRLKEIHRLLTHDGQLIIGDVVRLRRLPSDLENKTPLWTRGLASAILQSEYASLLESAGFQMVEAKSAEVTIDSLIAAYDGSLAPTDSPPNIVSEADWIASTQACCGLGAPRSESLAEILKCDNIGALWATICVSARNQGISQSLI